MNTNIRIVLALWVGVLLGCSQQVRTGSIVTCKTCRVQISNDVATISVPMWKSDQYHVTERQDYCATCGAQPVSYRVTQRCRQCDREYWSEKLTAPRRSEPKDIVKRDGFCSTSCERTAKIDQTIDKVSEKTGDMLGRIGRGLSDGILKHAK